MSTGQLLPTTTSTRTVSGYQFSLIGAINPERDANDKIATFTPHTRYRNAKNLPLNKYGRGPFCRFSIAAHVHVGGVYLIMINSQIRYIGECEALSARYGLRNYGSIQPRNCYQGGQSTNCKINHHILVEAQQGNQIELWYHQMPGASKPARKAKEATLIAALNPLWNG